MSKNDRKTQMRSNIKWHRQKRLQRIEYTDDTYSKSKTESVSNDIEKSHLNYNIEPTIEVINPEPSVTVIKKLSEQLIEEINNYGSSDESDGEMFDYSEKVTIQLSDELIEEMQYSDNDNGISFEDSDDYNISAGTVDWNEAFQIPNESDG